MLELFTLGPKFTRPACQAAASIDRYLLPAGLSAANSPAAAAAVN